MPGLAVDEQSLCVSSELCGANLFFPPHTHPTLQVVFSLDGTLTASTTSSEWRAPPHSMVWIPPHRQHGLAVARPCKVFCIHLSTHGLEVLDDCSVSPVSTLVIELVVYLARSDRSVELARQACLKQIIREELQCVDSSACRMQLPLDRRAARIARAILAEPSNPRTLHEWASEVGACERTLSRVFERQTGLTFKKWQQRSRLLRAVELLRQGVPVTEVALTVGYESVSAFISIFRKEYGVTPGAYVNAPRSDIAMGRLPAASSSERSQHTEQHVAGRRRG